MDYKNFCFKLALSFCVIITVTFWFLSCVYYTSYVKPEIEKNNNYEYTNCTIINKYASKSGSACYYPVLIAFIISSKKHTGTYRNYNCFSKNESVTFLSQYQINSTYPCYFYHKEFLFELNINKTNFIKTMIFTTIAIVFSIISCVFTICSLVYCCKTINNKYVTI